MENRNWVGCFAFRKDSEYNERSAPVSLFLAVKKIYIWSLYINDSPHGHYSGEFLTIARKYHRKTDAISETCFYLRWFVDSPENQRKKKDGIGKQHRCASRRRKRVKPIKSNVANSFNGRDPNLPIYLEGYRARSEASESGFVMGGVN